MEAIQQAIRQAALRPEAWADLQLLLNKHMNTIGSQLSSIDHSQDNAIWSRTTLKGVDEEFIKFGPTSEPVLHAAANPNWSTITDYDFIDEAGMDNSAFYKTFAQFDIRYRLAIRLINHESISRAMVLIWDKKRGHATRRDFEKLKPVIEPLRLSAHVALAMGESLSSEKLLIDNLARSRSAALVVDPDAGIVLSNNLIDPILQKADGISTLRNELVLQDRKSRVKFSNLLKLAGGAARNSLPTGGGILAAPRPSGLPAYIIMVSPLPKREQFLGAAKGLVLVVIHDTTEATELERSLYMDGFGMTAAEADVAAWFVNGIPLEQIATRRGVSLHTVRQQFKDILKKTGTHRQAELAVLLASFTRR
ncbi:helix-turn-helix transcriptional regulator [Cohaesibacter celericrescens]|uniref:HTH luxR-type domain-containing protein n=1 Tax=Cohaesibacter celericrescens TaxID=2067669 RepID=A0A2N5XNS5_9HYPH|nr:helix-turn-helix transcriptional regulator [Cohaesibacter celericrescens]PLW76154.1 hypothetical protein C0081_14670 [Cohaesibacter celericrescens]